METAVAELDTDIRRSIRATMRTTSSPPPTDFLESDQSFLAAYKDIEEVIIPFLPGTHELFSNSL